MRIEAAATVALGSQCDAQGHPRKGRLQGRGLRNAKIPPPIPSTMPIPCPCMPPTQEANGFYRDAARRVATSSEKWENRI